MTRLACSDCALPCIRPPAPAWAGLRGIDLELIRTATRGQVGGYMEGRIRLRNRLRLPKSWLEVVEFTDLPDPSPGRGVAVVWSWKPV